MSTDPYSTRTRELFAHPAHAGLLERGPVVYADAQDVRLQLSAEAAGGVLEAMRFQAWGCPHVLAACEAVCSDFEGRASDDLGRFAVAELMQSLCIPVEKTGRILVIEDAMRLLSAAHREDSTPDH